RRVLFRSIAPGAGDGAGRRMRDGIATVVRHSPRERPPGDSPTHWKVPISQFHDVRSGEHPRYQTVTFPVRFEDREAGHRHHAPEEIAEDTEDTVGIVLRLKNACRFTECLCERVRVRFFRGDPGE